MEPRRHHFVTAGYLAGFTDTANEDGFLVVSDLVGAKQFKSRPKATAHRRDYYRLEGPPSEGDPFVLEKQLGEMEGRAIVAIQEIVETKAFPKGEGLSSLVNFLALTLCRTPRAREAKQREFKEFLRLHAIATVNKPGEFEKMLVRAKERGEEIGPDITRESFAQWAIEGKFEVATGQNKQLNDMLGQASIYVDEMAKMRWSVVLVDPSIGKLVTSDHPVAITPYGNPETGGRIGLVDPRAQVTFPLAPSIALLGQWDKGYPRVINADHTGMVKLNYHTVWKAQRFVYSTHEDFIWATQEDGKNYGYPDLMEATKDGAREDWRPGPGYVEVPANFTSDPEAFFEWLAEGGDSA